jgi:hypothetical protein
VARKERIVRDYHATPAPTDALDLPPWVPVIVQAAARQEYAEAVRFSKEQAHVAAIKRLATDQRMRDVWRELMKKSGRGGGYAYPANERAVFGPVIEPVIEHGWDGIPKDRRLQQQAEAQIFLTVAFFFGYRESYYQIGPPIRTKAEIEAWITDLRRMAGQLRAQATTLARLGLPNQAHLINGVAEHCDIRSLYAIVTI